MAALMVMLRHLWSRIVPPTQPPATTVGELEDEVTHLQRTVKWRTGMALMAILFAIAGYVTLYEQLQDAVHDNTCTARNLVYFATPTEPRALGPHGPLLHYTADQKAFTVAFRKYLLANLPEASCPPLRSGAS